MTDVRIPEPGGVIKAGQVITGQAITGQGSPADLWETYPLDLPAGSAEVITVAPTHVTVAVEVTGNLDLPAETAEITSVRNATLVASDAPLELAGDGANLKLDFTVNPQDGTLVLDAGATIVNPALIPELCEELELALAACTPLALVPVAPDVEDLEPLVCLEA